MAQTVTNARNLCCRQEHVCQFFSEETDWRSGLYTYSQKNSHNFPYLQKIYRVLLTHLRRQGLKLLILTFKRSQLVVVGYYRTTGEFFLVSANSSTIVLYNMRLRREGGKENALSSSCEHFLSQ